jgi:hypothetical protein
VGEMDVMNLIAACARPICARPYSPSNPQPSQKTRRGKGQGCEWGGNCTNQICMENPPKHSQFNIPAKKATAMNKTTSPWLLARRAAKMNPSVIREILKVTEKPGIISFAGGLPSPKTFPVAEFEAACAKVLRDDPSGALQYAASEGYGPLREMVAAMLPWQVDPAQVLITTGSQQGLDLVAKVLIDAGSRVLVESPTYLGAVMAFTPMEPRGRQRGHR